MIKTAMIDDAVAQALQLNLSFLAGPGQARHVPFAFTPCGIGIRESVALAAAAPLLGRLTQALASDTLLIQSLHAPLAAGDPFFAELLSIHRELHIGGADLPRLPLLLQRSDFMLDANIGPQLVECNSIAAGMAPFGDRVQQLHRYLQDQWPQEFLRYSAAAPATFLPNPATVNLAEAVSAAAWQVRAEHGDGGAPVFLMVVQENEDNIFDQRLLEHALRALGVVTLRRTFRQLHAQLASGPNQRLLLQGVGAIDVVYLRAGYQYRDYIATDLDSRQCCDALRATRVFVERHRVAVNATVAQQLATSKRMQQYLSRAPAEGFSALGFLPDEIVALQEVFAEMRAIESHSSQWLQEEGGVENWVLKNQGEGGGHCLFNQDIIARLDTMPVADYPAWTLMRRLRPAGREVPTLVVRGGQGEQINRLVSEIGFFTAHLEGRPLLTLSGQGPGYVGYLVRSKPPDVAEGGVHSGSGMLDSLVLSE